MLADLRYRLRALFSSRAADREMDEELQFHLQHQAEKYRLSGLSPDEAARRARLDFGGPQQIRENCREARGLGWLDGLGQDLRYALRTLSHSPVFATVAVLSLALGIGANTALFSVLDALLLKPLPVRESDRLVSLGQTPDDDSFTYAIWQQIRARQDVFSELCAYSAEDFDLASGGEKQLAHGIFVTGNFFDVLGVPAHLGRTFTAADDVRSGPPVAVLSYDFWQRHYGGDPHVAGGFLRLDGHPFQIVGVARRGFFGMDVGDRFDVAIPVTAEALMHPQRIWMDQAYSWWLTIVGRLKPGLDPARASAQLNILGPAIFQATVPENQHNPNLPWFVLKPAAHGLSNLRGRENRQALLLLMGMVGLVLLIACANLANLLLSRAGARSREVAVRLALGAGRARLVRQLLTESLLLSVSGAALGAVFAQFAARLLVAWISSSRNARFLDLAPDARVLAFTAGLALVTGLIFGLAPALAATRLAPQAALKEGSRGLTRSRRPLGLGRALVALQVALTLVLLCGAGLFVRSLNLLVTQDVGFRRDHLLLVEPDLRATQFSRDRQSAAAEDLLYRLRTLPGVTAAARSVVTPISGMTWQWNVKVDSPGGSARSVHAYFNLVSPDFFRTMGTALLSGRDFTADDTAKAPQVAVVNETAAAALFPGVNPVGRIYRDRSMDHTEWTVQVVGVVKDARYRRLRDQPPPTIYVPITQNPSPFQVNGIYELRFSGPVADLAARVKEAVHETDPRISLLLQLLTTQVDDSLLRERLVARLASFFGALALVLAAIGLYGVVAYSASHRRAEIGIRMALGATRQGVMWLVLRETAALLFVGVVSGLAASMGAGRLARALLYGLTPTDPPTVAAAIAALLLTAGCAGYLPARQASLADPLASLREE